VPCLQSREPCLSSDLAAHTQHVDDNADDETLQDDGAVPKVYESDEDIDGDDDMQHIMSSMDVAHSHQAVSVTEKEAIKAITSGGRGDEDGSGEWSIPDLLHDDGLTLPARLLRYDFMSAFDNVMSNDVFF